MQCFLVKKQQHRKIFVGFRFYNVLAGAANLNTIECIGVLQLFYKKTLIYDRMELFKSIRLYQKYAYGAFVQ
jgi:hypothetical protein